MEFIHKGLKYNAIWFNSYNEKENKTYNIDEFLEYVEKYRHLDDRFDQWCNDLRCDKTRDMCPHMLLIEDIEKNTLAGYIWGYITLSHNIIYNDVNILIYYRNRGLCKVMVSEYAKKLIDTYGHLNEYKVHVNDTSTLREMKMASGNVRTAMESCYLPAYVENNYSRDTKIPISNNQQEFIYRNKSQSEDKTIEDDEDTFLANW